MFAEGAFSQAFVPVLAEHKNRDPREAMRDLIDRVATLLLLALVAVAALGMALAPLIVYLTAPGFAADPEKFALTVELLRITFPYIVFISLVALAAGHPEHLEPVLGARVHAGAAQRVVHRRALFFADASSRRCWRSPGRCSPAACCSSPSRCRSWCGSACCRAGASTSPTPACGASSSSWRRRRSACRSSQVSLLINQVFASFLVTGSVSWLYYADRLMELPAGVLGVALGTILLPSLSKYHAGCERTPSTRACSTGGCA